VETVERSEVKHAGLNMLEELAWVNSFIDKGTYVINFGSRYWAELVNPIPRGLWPGKPLIGIDCAIARGQGWEDQDEGLAGVGATISTGMIGQGVVNFGPFFGVLSSALLMAFWPGGIRGGDSTGGRWRSWRDKTSKGNRDLGKVENRKPGRAEGRATAARSGHR
jgi:hypothetical protein